MTLHKFPKKEILLLTKLAKIGFTSIPKKEMIDLSRALAIYRHGDKKQNPIINYENY